MIFWKITPFELQQRFVKKYMTVYITMQEVENSPPTEVIKETVSQEQYKMKVICLRSSGYCRTSLDI